ncbi:MAG: hypothetical protein MUC88_11215 [Planctomycetes bacterium]|jgi:hypothetical protein|nr:hypothetical protein [Planctomycetota bacterium]
MRRRRYGSCSGFTLADMAVSLAIGTVLILILTVLLADNQKAFNEAYGGAFCTVAEEGFTTRTIFRKTIRQACAAAGTVSLAPDGSWVAVQYYSRSGVSAPDRTARFERSGNELLLRRGVRDTGQTLSVETVCGNVASVEFSLAGEAVQMFLVLDDGASSQTVNTSAARRNP